VVATEAACLEDWLLRRLADKLLRRMVAMIVVAKEADLEGFSEEVETDLDSLRSVVRKVVCQKG